MLLVRQYALYRIPLLSTVQQAYTMLWNLDPYQPPSVSRPSVVSLSLSLAYAPLTASESPCKSFNSPAPLGAKTAPAEQSQLEPFHLFILPTGLQADDVFLRPCSSPEHRVSSRHISFRNCPCRSRASSCSEPCCIQGRSPR